MKTEKKISMVLVTLAVLTVCGSSFGELPKYKIIDIGMLNPIGDDEYSIVWGINDAGQAIGDDNSSSGFFWEDGVKTRIFSGGDRTWPRGINNAGQVVGYFNTSTGSKRAFIWDSISGFSDIGIMNGRAFAINDSGQVAGWYSGNDHWSHPFLWDSINGMIDLGTLGGSGVAYGLNNNGQVVGGSNSPSGAEHPFLWDSVNGMIDLGTLGGETGFAIAVNNIGQVVGGSRISTGDPHAFFWDSTNGMIDLGTFGGYWSEAFSINDNGQVIGGAYTDDDEGGDQHAFLWDSENGLMDLYDLLPEDCEWVNIHAMRINNNGHIWGRGIINNELHIFLMIPLFTYHVDGTNGNNGNDGLTRETAFATIQYGIDTAVDGDSVVVWPGVYNESVYFIDKAITVKASADAPILEAAGSNGVSFYTSEGQETVLANFVIRDSDTGIFVSTGTPTIRNITLAGNGLGIEAENGAVPDIRNCIFWNNTNGDLWNCTAQYSCIEETGAGEGNISSDPLFADVNNGDYHLLSERGRYRATTDEWILDEVSSPCIDGGEPNVGPSEEAIPNGGRINMGAYGGTGTASMSEWGLEADFDYDGIVANGDVGILSDDWLEELTFADDAEFTLSYEITDLGTLDCYGRVWAINENGQVAGGYQPGGIMHAVVWDPVIGKIDLGFLGGGGGSRANYINNSGYAVGGAWAGDDNHAFIWDDVNGMVDLGTLYFNDLYFSEAFCINDAGQVVGGSYTEQGSRAFLWDSVNGMVNLGTLGGSSGAYGINNSGQVVGYTGSPNHAFLWDSTNGMIDLGTLGGDCSDSQAINNAGQVVGLSQVASLNWHGFLWDSVNGMVDLGTLGGDSSGAVAINDAGQVVGYADTPVASEHHAFLWDSTNGMIDLSELALEDAGFTQITHATGINNRGQIVGYGEISGEVHAFVMTPATTWHVDGAGGSNNNDGLTRETAFATIQKGVSSAEDCDTVVVWPGVYDGPVYIVDKAIVVKSGDEAAVIDGGFDDAVVFYSWEGKEAVLKNFVIKNGFAGVYVYNGQPELANLTIVDCYTGIEAETGAEPNIVSTILWDNDYDLWNCTAQYSFVGEDFDANLVSYWKLDGDAVDSVGTNNGTIYGAVPTTGQIGEGLDFDGVDDYVEIAYDASLDFQGGNITVAGWFNLIGYYEDTGLVTDKDDGHHTQFELSIGRMDLPWPYSYYPAFGFCDMYWRTAVASQQYTGWHHIAGTYDGNTLKIYVDGMEEGSTFDITGLPDDYDSAKYIGRSHDTSGNQPYFGGTIDEVAIYNRALTAEEIEAIYEVGLAGGEYGSPLFANANAGDYHLLSERGRYRATMDEWILDEVSSPAIDGGDPYASLAGERRPNGGRINMGAYGGTTQASRSEWPFAGDLNLDGVVNLADFAILAEDWLEALPWAE